MTHELTSAPNWLFSVQLYQPAFCNTASAIQSLRVRLLSTIASIRFLCFFFFLKSTRPFFYKTGCTRQFESELSFRSLAPLFPIKEGITSLLVLQQSIRPLFGSPVSGGQEPQRRRGNRSSCRSYPLRYMVDGPSEVSPECLCGMVSHRELCTSLLYPMFCICLHYQLLTTHLLIAIILFQCLFANK